MFALEKNKVQKHDKKTENLYSSQSNGIDYNINKYVFQTTGYASSIFYADEKFDESLLDFLLEKATLIKFNTTGKLSFVLKNKKHYRGGSFWFSYKDVFLKIAVVGEDSDSESFFSIESTDNDKKYNQNKVKKYDLTVFAPSYVKDFHLKDFEKFITKEDGCKIHIFIKNQYGDYNFEPLKVRTPEIDVGLNYGKKFVEIDKKIQERLLNNNNGLFMFHGKPGTGKTTYIKYLASKINKDFIFIPTTMVETFTSDPNTLQYLIQKPNSILILEDAEKAVLKRYGDNLDSSNVSALLNLSDGILSDMLKMSVILTYNCAKNEIDAALKRKGRLQADYEFNLMEVDDAVKLATHLKKPKDLIETITEPISLADIYNLGKDVEFKNELICEIEERIIGFGKS
jgi:hypothetical protein